MNDEMRYYHQPLLAEVRGQDQQEAGTFVAALGSAQGQYLSSFRVWLRNNKSSKTHLTQAAVYTLNNPLASR